MRMSEWWKDRQVRPWLILSGVMAVALAILAAWAWKDFADYQTELKATLEAPTNDAQWRAAEAQQHAAGFAYGAMLFSAFGLLVSLVGVAVVGLTLRATLDIAFTERRPWLSITKIAIKTVERKAPDGKTPVFCVGLTFSIKNTGLSAATDLVQFVGMAVDTGDNLEQLVSRMHGETDDSSGHRLTNVAPSHTLQDVLASESIKVPAYDPATAPGLSFVFGIRLKYRAGRRGDFVTSQFLCVGNENADGDIDVLTFAADGKPVENIEFTSCEGGLMT